VGTGKKWFEPRGIIPLKKIEGRFGEPEERNGGAVRKNRAPKQSGMRAGPTFEREKLVSTASNVKSKKSLFPRNASLPIYS